MPICQCDEYVDVVMWRFNDVNKMDTYGLIGFTLKHSFSAKFFTEKFELEEIDAEYLNFEIEDIHEIRRVVLFHQHLRGINVTIPYKEKIIPFLHEISPEAEKIGAVNVIRVDRKPGDMYAYRLIGYNTDYIGFRDSLAPMLNPALHKKPGLGYRGASKAVVQALDDLNIDWLYVSRTPGKETHLCNVVTGNIVVSSSYCECFTGRHLPAQRQCPKYLIGFLHPITCYSTWCIIPKNPVLKKGKEKGATDKKRPGDAGATGTCGLENMESLIRDARYTQRITSI